MSDMDPIQAGYICWLAAIGLSVGPGFDPAPEPVAGLMLLGVLFYVLAIAPKRRTVLRLLPEVLTA